MFNVDTKLFAAHLSAGYTEAEWHEILMHLVNKLEEFLGQPVETSGIKFWPDGFAGDIGSPTSFAGSLRLSWFGRIGVTVLGHNERTYPEVTIFLRGAGKRLVAISGEAFLSLEYRQITPGVCAWTAPDWRGDEFGEYEAWE